MPNVNPGQPTFIGTPTTVTNRLKSAGPEVVVRLQALDGTWETCGVDRLTRIFPENVSLSSDSWGPKTASFDLRRDPTLPWPDVLAFTPVKIEVDGQLVWSGRVSETPSREGAETVMTINCEGWQHHLDDDMLHKLWVHSDVTKWTDVRSFPNSDIATRFLQGPQVTTDNGVVVLAFQAGRPTSGAGRESAGVGLDLGPFRLAEKITVVYDWANPTAVALAFVQMQSAVMGGDSGVTPWTGNIVSLAAGGSGTNATVTTTAITGGRNLFLALRHTNAGAITPATDAYVRIKSIIVYGDSGFEQANDSVLKASRVVADALATAPLLSTSTDAISSTSFSLPEYAPDEPRTGREHINAVNGFHGWTTKVDAFRRLNYYPKPSRAKYDAGEYSLKESSDSAGSSGAEIYNKAIVTGQDAGGLPVQVTRYAGPYVSVPAAGGPSNPSFEVDTSGWSTPQGTLARTTTAGEFESGIAGGRLTSTGGGSAGTYTDFGPLRSGRTYRVTVRLKAGGTGFQNASMFLISLPNGVFFGRASDQLLTISPSGFATYTLEGRLPLGDEYIRFYVSGSAPSGTGHLYIDSLEVLEGPTLVDRRGFNKAFNLSVNTMLPSDGVLAASIGDAWLANHSTTSFKGDVTFSGPNSLRDRLSGQPVPLYQLLADTDELIHFSDRINPDTGAMGRTARITNVTYTPLEDKAVVTLDNTRTDFETLLNRLGAT